MTIKTLFTKRVRRYACAALASAVTTFVGLQALSIAEAQSCTLQDATRWQTAVSDTEMELTPAYVRFVTETFLRACPERPEFQGASRVAGIAAADLGDPAAAVRHFRNAGRMRDTQSNFYAIAVNLAVGNDRAAWDIRDQMVEIWQDRLDRNPLVSIASVQVEGGIIYQVQFTERGSESGPKSAWVGVPSGPGWPATLSFSNDRMLMAMRAMRTGTDNPTVRRIELNRCYGRRSLGQLDPRLTSVEFDGAAIAGLSAYLANPDLEIELSDTAISPCYLSDRLLPTPLVR